MEKFEKLEAFLKENPVFYFATVDGNEPRVRPFGFHMFYKGKLYFGIGDHKESYRQVKKNPHIEISTANAAGDTWLRVRGTVEFDDSSEALEQAFRVHPSLKKIYNDETGAGLGLVFLQSGRAEFLDRKGNFEQVIL